MSIRSILVPIAGQANDRELLTVALSVAKSLGAHVSALFVRAEPTEYLPVMGEGYSGMVAQDIIDAVEGAADEMATKAKEATEAAAREAGVALKPYGECHEAPSISFHQTKGPILAVLQEESQLTDLIVCAQPTPGLGPEISNVLPDLLIGCHRPFLIVPEGAKPFRGAHVVIGWDGGSEAASAVRQARGFLPLFSRVEIVAIGDDKEENKAEVERPASYLACHGVKVETVVLEGSTKSAGDMLMDYAVEHGAELIVMGAYGHSRMREFIFGGATRQILQDMKLPVYMAH
ncbi:MAG: universal stress protein [Alphaproteobacteria bacterium]|nr:MAG: universal stress protein [Alphaproteobacteria bacterium]